MRSCASRLSAFSSASPSVEDTALGDMDCACLLVEDLAGEGFNSAEGDLLGTPRPVVVGFRRGVRAAIDSSSPFEARELVFVAVVIFFVVADVLGVLGPVVAYHLVAVHLVAVAADRGDTVLDTSDRDMLVEFILSGSQGSIRCVVSCRPWLLEVESSRVGQLFLASISARHLIVTQKLGLVWL